MRTIVYFRSAHLGGVLASRNRARTQECQQKRTQNRHQGNHKFPRVPKKRADARVGISMLRGKRKMQTTKAEDANHPSGRHNTVIYLIVESFIAHGSRLMTHASRLVVQGSSAKFFLGMSQEP